MQRINNEPARKEQYSVETTVTDGVTQIGTDSDNSTLTARISSIEEVLARPVSIQNSLEIAQGYWQIPVYPTDIESQRREPGDQESFSFKS